jgi:hypothetical protein
MPLSYVKLDTLLRIGVKMNRKVEVLNIIEKKKIKKEKEKRSIRIRPKKDEKG